jgi:FMN phosphatase YigB (HAD superfamily)
MINTIMFDLDGTLVRFVQDDFLKAYFTELSKVFFKLGLDADRAVKAVWAGTKAMMQNDGSVLNTQRFWSAFSEFMGIEGELLESVEAACDNFYSNEFNTVKSVVKFSEIPKRLVREMAARGYCVVLATNPLFPPCAVDSRLDWIGLNRHDFKLITNYENSRFCKPNLAYYEDVFSKIDRKPQQCLMVGNNPAEDMCVSRLGSEVFLVTDYMENEAGLDITTFRYGTIEELEAFLMSLPKL